MELVSVVSCLKGVEKYMKSTNYFKYFNLTSVFVTQIFLFSAIQIFLIKKVIH